MELMAKRMEELSRRYLPQHDWALAEQDWWETHSNTQFTTTRLHKKSQKVKFKMKYVQRYWAQVFSSVLGPTSPRENLALSIQCFEVGYVGDILLFQFHIFQLDLDLNWFLFIENDSKSKHRCSAKGVNSESLLSKNFPCHEEPALLHLCGSNDHSQVVWQKIELQVRAEYLSFAALHKGDCDPMLQKIQIS